MEHQIYLEALKKALKARAITYSDLAKSLKLTESGIKKMLNAKDISFQRLIKICKVLDVLPGQFLSISEKSKISTVSFTDKQQEALIKNRNLLAAYWLFTIEKKTEQEIATLQNVSVREIKITLQKLVSLDLISQKKTEFFPKHHGKFRWPDDSKIARFLNLEWSRLVLDRSLKSKPDQQTLHRLSVLRLSESSCHSLVEKLTLILDESVQISEREELSHSKKDLIDFTLLLAAAEGSLFTAE